METEQERKMKTIKLENPTLLTSLTNNQCKFPLWKNSNEPQLFCGRKITKKGTGEYE